MRVVHIINGLARGGGERLLVRAVSGLTPRGFTFSVFTLTRLGPLARELEDRGVSVHRLNWNGVPLPWQWLRLLAEVKQADVVHTHFFYSDVVGAVLRPLIRRLVATRHDTGEWMRAWHHRVEPGVYRRFDRVLGVSQAVVDSLRSRGVDAARLVHLPPGVGAVERSSGAPLVEPPYVLSVGRLEKVKGHDLLLEAFSLLARDAALDSFRLVVAGDGAERRALARRAEQLGVTARCVLLGERDPVAIATLLAHAAIFVLPSRAEALGLSLLEAMQHGVPCVATAVGGVPEAMRDSAGSVLVVPDDAPALAEAMRRLIHDAAAARQQGAVSAAQVEARYDLGRFLDGLTAVYRNK